ncbi:MAG: YdiU family protein [Xanthomonadales bacterium]|nr:YdiU family protein [Gammaproteobacteria bacterium]MBT8054046.1 YdiU family protein [Gammaproteobacteria bacterium]NND57423.1 YdiU family protein [Xanthomonadales bacterium]NNK50352.1 YdiU family protein [Xanthomonadales bacterium]
MSDSINFDNSYLELPGRFYSKLAPTPVAGPGPIRVNRALAEQLDLDAAWLSSEQGTEMLAGNRLPDGAEPIATVYAGHQFGGWVPQLGDGRAILLGEVIGRDGQRYDIQLKGSGPTPYSRGGDGRAPLGPVLREYIVSEAMSALGIPTTRSLAAVTSGEPVYRQAAEPGAVLTRVARSHIRIGTFQYFLARQDIEALRLLVDYVVRRHYPAAAEAEIPAQEMLDAVVTGQARLMAQWQLVGFIHGVMNTDNMLLSGETIDYGPCAFMDHFDPSTVFSSIDRQGRYAYGNQPGTAHWNLARLAQTLLPVMHADEEQALVMAQESLDAFPDRFQQAYRDGMARKLGLNSLQADHDELVSEWLELMARESTDFTLAFRRLADLALPGPGPDVAGLFEFSEAFSPWLERWRQCIEADPQSLAERRGRMYEANPVFIPRNHLVAGAIDAAVSEGDFEPFHRLVDRLEQPHDYDPQQEDFARPPRKDEIVTTTFCGT